MRPRSVWRCSACGYGAPRWIGRCPDCGEYDCFVEELETRAATAGSSPRDPVEPRSLSDISADEHERVSSGIPEFDRVLGGGLVRGSVVLLGGEPGVGKSTLLLQAATRLAGAGQSVLYACGEESPGQIRLRAERIGAVDGVAVLPEPDVRALCEATTRHGATVLVVDSIQTARDPELEGVPGSVSQVRAATAALVRLAKDSGVTVVLVGHVTKEGSIAGPRVLEHMVDTVLYVEGDRDRTFRVVRAAKNRFGSVSEIGLFEMTADGLVGIEGASAALLGARPPGVAGSVVVAAMEGTRPLLVEVQALVTPSHLDMPRRLATGVDRSRLLQVIAILERRADLVFGQHDVYVSMTGGVRVLEPAADLPLALALASARTDVPVPTEVAAFGELGLTGEVRPAPQAATRAGEAVRLGCSRIVAAPAGLESTDAAVLAVERVSDALSALF